MQRSRLVLGLAAVFAGMTVLLAAVAAALRSPVVGIVALPIAVATYVFWYHASGMLRADASERARRRAARGGRRRRAEAPGGARGQFKGAPGGFGAGPVGDGPGRGGRGETRARGGRRASPRTGPDEPTRAEAYATLGLQPDADEQAVRRAYRERVKQVHPDRGGDEEEFKSVTRAYERLT